ncbi:hypothetical protein BaRGS_00000423 [Batillaria attramentaria]|uniref:Peptidase C45 hydrolase domain-containing protein n=1 Tax=Batillaria attramentaria TaxID=370345 RepID=A0ABD0M8P2_9CAEN|nr:hypothetical protein BaRGS_020425 [Batillaria attramentaria]
MDTKPSREPRYPCLTQLSTRGTFYDVGYNVGLNFSQRIQLFFAESDNIQQKLLPFYHTRVGRDYYEESLRIMEQCFPHYVREVRGIADGAGLPFEHVFMANVSKEVYNVLFDQLEAEGGLQQTPEGRTKSAPEAACSQRNGSKQVNGKFQENFGCSEIFINRPDLKLVVHNEDCDPMIKPYGYLLHADIEDGDVHEQFTSFCYPGFLPGCAYSFNAHGLTITLNGLYPDRIMRDCPSRIFLNRALLSARDLDDVVRIARNEPYGAAYGFCANISTADGDMAAVEVGPNKPRADVHVHRVEEERDPDKPCHYYHFNSYKHLKVPEIEGLMSSTLRGKRSDELPPPRDLRDALVVMGDTKDPLGPIFRTPRPTDLGLTVATAVFDVMAREVFIYQGNPAPESNKPFVRLPMYK